MAFVEMRLVDEFSGQDVSVKVSIGPAVTIGHVAAAFDSFLLAAGFHRDSIEQMWEEGK